MKNKNQKNVAVEGTVRLLTTHRTSPVRLALDSEQEETSSQQGNGKHETGTGEKSTVHVTDADKEKGNLKHFKISKKTVKKLKARGIEFLYPVQAASYAAIHEQKDCLIQARTGAGKTMAFVLPIVELLLNDTSVELEAGRAPRVLVLVPTKEMTKQISDDIQTITADLTVATIFSAKKKADTQEVAISNGCDFLIATPDRLNELVGSGKVDLTEVKHVVLDEMDQMLEAPAVDEVKKALKQVFQAGKSERSRRDEISTDVSFRTRNESAIARRLRNDANLRSKDDQKVLGRRSKYDRFHQGDGCR